MSGLFASKQRPPDDPDQYRMTVGEHLEELRHRLILALLGMGLTLIVCLIFGRQVVSIFCAPLMRVLMRHEVNPQVYFTGVGDPFFVFIKISIISAVAISSPWMLYQLWRFVSAGLYPHERKIVTRYIPLSVSLLIGGMAFVYFLVLPWTLEFFIVFSGGIPMPQGLVRGDQAVVVPAEQRLQVPAIAGDPIDPLPHELWFDTISQRFKTYHNGRIRVLQMLPETLTAPIITLPDYIGLVLMMLVTFGLSFQLPLVVLALARIGIVEIEQLREGRRYVYFGLVIVAALITPGDAITATVALTVPLILLYEFGIWLARAGGSGQSISTSR